MMKQHDLRKTLCLFVLLSCSTVGGIQDGDYSLQDAIRRREEAGLGDHALSRRKRYLTFPDGSSLQLLFCVQTSALIPIGDIFLYGNTAAFAWKLPKDPTLLHMLEGKRGDQLRREDDLDQHLDREDQLQTTSRPVYRPVFARRSVEDTLQVTEDSDSEGRSSQREWDATEAPPAVDRKRMHEEWRRDFMKMEYTDESSIEFHRHSRKELYEKLEIFLKALGINGRECVRRALCEVGAQSTNGRQGTIVQEMMRAVFTLVQGRQFEKGLHREYDAAHRAASPDPATAAAPPAAYTDHASTCARLYPDCDGNVASLPLFG